MAPVERSTQCLVAPKRKARPRGQQTKALVKPCPYAVDAEQLNARSSQFDRQRNAVQPAADLDDCPDVHSVSTTRGSTACARATKSSIAPVRRATVNVLWSGTAKRSETIDTLVRVLQDFLARGKDVHVNGSLAEAPRPCGRPHPASARNCREAAADAARPKPGTTTFSAEARVAYGNAEPAGDRHRDQRRIRQWGHFDDSCTVRELASQQLCATACASRVFPMPAGPTTVTNS